MDFAEVSYSLVNPIKMQVSSQSLKGDGLHCQPLNQTPLLDLNIKRLSQFSSSWKYEAFEA